MIIRNDEDKCGGGPEAYRRCKLNLNIIADVSQEHPNTPLYENKIQHLLNINMLGSHQTCILKWPKVMLRRNADTCDSDTLA